jgi:hypothetical protein
MKAEDGRRSVHVHSAILLPIAARVKRITGASAKTGHFGLPINGAEELGRNLPGVNHEADVSS